MKIDPVIVGGRQRRDFGLAWLWAFAVFVLVAETGLSAAPEFPAPKWTPVERLSPERLQAAHGDREELARQRSPIPELWGLEDFRAVIHVHADDSNHTFRTGEQVLAAAKKAGVRAVLLSDRRGPQAETWRGFHEGVLFLPGAEDDEGHWRFPRSAGDSPAGRDDDLRFVSRVEERLDFDPKGFAGLEIVHRHSDPKLGLQAFLAGAATNGPAWAALTNSFARWPDEFFAAGSDYRPTILAKWDRELSRARLTAIGANDARQNILVREVTFDPYEISFRNLSTHLLARELTEPEVRRALRQGHCYVSHDWLADPTGFLFGAVNNLGVFPMGDTVPMQGSTRVVSLTPVPARQRLIFDGRVVAETNGTNLTFRAKKVGAYRLEAWLEIAGEWRPWIYSNPIHLEEQSIFNLPLPNAVESPKVEVRKDITYTDGLAKDEAKHKLDLFVPQSATVTPAPVFLFMHGGAWRTGDRRLYGPIGQRFARDGILTVVPSYRLAPKIPWPAQAEDTAAAIAWTVRQIASYGGDTNRIFIGGHSAGGHLTSLMVFNPRYLQAQKLSANVIRGVISLSGVYDLDFGDAMASVFGANRDVRRDASPLFGIATPAPPFFVSYCEWDYPALAGQAKVFYRALKKAGVEAQLFFTPKDNHIYEVISMTRDDDDTSRAVSRFILGPVKH